MKLLSVDDALEMLKTFRDIEAHGYDVHEAENGEKVLTKYGDTKPDVVLTDILMPRLDGTWTKKGKKSYFGYKLHQKTDVDYSLIRASHV